MTITGNLPQDLREKARFCCWRLENRPGEDKPAKIPYNPHTGGKAQSNNPSTFTTLTKAEEAQAQYSGIGVGVFDDLGAIDIDHCLDESGSLSEMAQDIVGIAVSAGAYVERSPRKTGIRILFWLPGFQYDKKRHFINCRKIGLEVYVAGSTNRFLTVTGDTLHGCDTMPDFSAGLQEIIDRYMMRASQPIAQESQEGTRAALTFTDGEIVRKAEKATNGRKFTALMAGDTAGYESQSEADLGLLNLLAFWTGRDAGQMDRIYRTSGLMRDKWDRAQSGSTYGALQIEKAISECKEVYNPSEFRKKQLADVQTGGVIIKSSKRAEEIVGFLEHLRPERNARYSWSDMGNGYLFADIFKDVARYVPERKKWFVYDGIRWVQDMDGLRAMSLCQKLADALVMYAAGIPSTGGEDDYINFARTWRKRARRETILKDAASVYPVSIAEFDTDPHTFNCLNGTLNLRTGEFKSHSPDDMLSKVSGVVYDPAARCERWEQFIDEVMQGDAEKAAFLQKAMGYALTGDTRFECFFILYGPKSRNGKGTSMETFMQLMGGYGKSAKPDTIAQKQMANGSGPSEDIARLAGARFVNISEPDQRLVLSAALVKTLTGNDTITARYLHENSFEYRPAFKLFINTNHLPKVTDVTLFNSGRVKLIPFERHFTPEEQDGNLKTELSQPENLSGILNWCIAGLQAIQEHGFDAPESVKAAMEDYRANSDKLGRFLADEMIEDVNGEVRTVDAYQRFVKWCEDNGFKAENAANFKQMMENVAEVRMKRPAGSGKYASPTNFIIGYRLRYDDFMPTDEPTPWSEPRAFQTEQKAMIV